MPFDNGFHLHATVPMSWLTTAICISIFLYISAICVYRLWLHPLRKYPGPLIARVTNLYGVYHAIKGDRHLLVYKLHQTYGDFVRVSPNIVSINQACAIKEIYGVGSNVQKGHVYRASIAQVGAASTFSSIDKIAHGHKRRILAPAFTEAALAAMEKYVLDHIRTFIDVISSSQDDCNDSWSGDLALWCNYLTFDVMGDLAFNKQFNMLTEGTNRYVPSLIDMNAHRQLIAGSSPFVLKWGLDRILSPGTVAGGKKLMLFAQSQAQQRSQADEEKKDFLYHLFGAMNKDGSPAYSDPKDVAAETRQLIVAGSDTTATQMAANFFYISTNLNVQAKLASEIRSTFNSVDDIRTGSTLNKCTYLKAVVEETLRMSPSVPGFLPREVLAGGITVAGHTFPKGVELAVPIYTIHHNPKYYPSPHKYDPERWIESSVGHDGVARAWGAFHPFSYGTRQCIGKRLAYTELWITIARAIWLFDFHYVSGGMEDKLGDSIVEYKLMDHFAAARSGPVVRFQKKSMS